MLWALTTGPARAEPVAAERAALTDARHRCEADLDRLERHAHEDARVAIERADCLVRLGHLETAGDAFDALFVEGGGASALTPHELGEGLALLAVVLARTGRLEQAEAARQRIPTEDSARAHRVEAVLLVASGGFDAAMGVATGGPSHPVTRANLARALADAGRHTDARSLLLRTSTELKGRAAANCAELLGWLER